MSRVRAPSATPQVRGRFPPSDLFERSCETWPYSHAAGNVPTYLEAVTENKSRDSRLHRSSVVALTWSTGPVFSTRAKVHASRMKRLAASNLDVAELCGTSNSYLSLAFWGIPIPYLANKTRFSDNADTPRPWGMLRAGLLKARARYARCAPICTYAQAPNGATPHRTDTTRRCPPERMRTDCPATKE